MMGTLGCVLTARPKEAKLRSLPCFRSLRAILSISYLEKKKRMAVSHQQSTPA